MSIWGTNILLETDYLPFVMKRYIYLFIRLVQRCPASEKGTSSSSEVLQLRAGWGTGVGLFLKWSDPAFHMEASHPGNRSSPSPSWEWKARLPCLCSEGLPLATAETKLFSLGEGEQGLGPVHPHPLYLWSDRAWTCHWLRKDISRWVRQRGGMEEGEWGRYQQGGTWACYDES